MGAVGGAPLNAAQADLDAVEAIVRAAGTSFYRGMRVLPPDRRHAMYAIYAFCRMVDDIADDDSAFAAKLPELTTWRDRVGALYHGQSDGPVTRILLAAVQRFDLRQDDFLAVIDGMQMDAETTIVAPDLAALDLYCDRVAAAVGRLSVRAFGDASAAADEVAYSLGRALQLTNILRDLQEDADRGRLYLPREWLDAAGVPHEPLAALRSPGLQQVCARVADLAHRHFRTAAAAMRRCDAKAMKPARLMGATYAAILSRLERRGWAPPQERVSLPAWQKLWLALRYGLAAVAFALGLAAAADAQESERRVALVIGNAGYQHVDRLANPGNDATLIADTLRKSGFALVGGGVQRDLDKPAFDRLVRDFGQQIQGADVALFYYAGHGMQVQGSNWLLPTDANPTRVQDLDFQLVNADLVLKQMDGAGTRLNIVLLDACRNNPFAGLGTRGGAGGLAQMRAPEGTLISFATQPGNVAADGSGADGPYALALAETIRQPGLDIFRLFNQVGLKVKYATQGSQQPWVSSSPIDGEFYFARGEATADVVAAPTLEAPASAQAHREAGAKPTPAQAADPQASLRQLAEQGQPQAQTDLGLLYARGIGVEKDYAAALQWLQRAAAQNSPRAQYNLGLMYERGYGVPRSYDTGLEWYRRAAAKNYPPAETAVARCYGRGLGVERDPAQRTSWLLRAATHGSSQAQFFLGNIYRRGLDVPQDLAAAAQWYQRAVLQEYAPAQLQFGLMYEHGNGVAQDDSQAARLLHGAAEKGNAVAQNALGMLYRRGQGVKQDYSQALRWLRASAEQGNALGELNLGVMYLEGWGVPRDRAAARRWFEQAAAGGNEAAQARLVRLDQAPGPQ